MRYLAIVLFIFTLSACSLEGVRYSPSEIEQFPEAVREHIRAGEVTLKMPPAAVRYAWGAPSEINILMSADDRYVEEWIYSKLKYFQSRLVFTDGKLTEIISGKDKKDKP